ncbi:MAG: ATP-binding cassette domain-containing protein [Aquimonas sp.]|jgi:iron complex transport system ATP-binding protein|nr:ATP-binding cassette domain-containing protein [Xanthomonadales bacterium]MCC6504786.1 ATP-binding cassette domain-containing protein [Aquimonas sp.]
MIEPPLIELDHATVMRGEVRALDDISLCVGAHESLAILGANGSGKSTLIKLLTRELFPLNDEQHPPVKILGQSRWVTADLHAQLGIVHSELADLLLSIPGLRVRDAILGGLRNQLAVDCDPKASPSELAKINAVAARVSCSDLLDRPLAELSAGQLRRSLVARAIVHQPRALLLDEPANGLDLLARHEMDAILRKLNAEGVGIWLITHHIEEIPGFIERVLILRQGRLIADGFKSSVLTAPQLSQAFGIAVDVFQRGHRWYASAR